MEELLAYLNSLNTEEQRRFAEACGTTVNYLRKACSTRQRLGPDLCIRIDRESGGAIRCEALRPDVDWAYLRVAPRQAGELAAAEAAG